MRALHIAAAAVAALALLLAACGGTGGTSTNQLGGTPVPLAGANVIDPPPTLPSGTVQLTYYYEFTSTTSQASLLTLHQIAQIPAGDKATWYSYSDGTWTPLLQAFSSGGHDPIFQYTFSPRPSSIVVLAEPDQ